SGFKGRPGVVEQSNASWIAFEHREPVLERENQVIDYGPIGGSPAAAGAHSISCKWHAGEIARKDA
ncbi:MAG: hypothetical protein WBX08_08940, partial [Candidatus Sulfotelmatobacter sp.]